METLPEENWKIIKRAKKFGARVILNLSPAQEIPKDVFKSVTILVINQIEAASLGLHLGFDVISPLVVARHIAATFGMTCIVTLGEKGAMACSPEGTWKVQPMKIEAVDTTSAGDAFMGILAASLDRGMDLPHALQYASVGSGLACLNNGAQPSLPTQNQIKENLSKGPLPSRIS